MTMTNEQINALTDAQINVMMTACELNITTYKVSSSGGSICRDEGHDIYAITVKDYCNDPSVMWALMISSNISVMKIFNEYIAFIGDIADIDNGSMVVGDSIRFFDKKPLRAAAIVYLKSKGVL